jgi:hypothetical protein
MRYRAGHTGQGHSCAHPQPISLPLHFLEALGQMQGKSRQTFISNEEIGTPS